MGKPDFLPPPSPSAGPVSPLAEAAGSISLNPTSASTAFSAANLSNHRQTYFDDDPTELAADELPPLYDEHESDAIPFVDPLVPTAGPAAGGLRVEPFKRDARSDTVYYMDARLDSDPEFLNDTLVRLSQVPPRPFAHIRGTHTETRRKSDDKTEQVTVVDFDIEIELTHLLYVNIQDPTNGAWRQLYSVGNLEKVRRGTVFPTRAPGFGGSGGIIENGEPTVEEWCHRFCASRAGLKNMVFERRVTGWDWDYLKKQLDRLVQDTNYRGHTSITFPVRNSRVEIYNVCRVNRMRLTKWIEVMFMLTLLFLFAWPYLFFRTKRWETAYAEWSMSREASDGTERRYASMSEAQWYHMWARAIQKAVLERRQGNLDQGDVERANQPADQAGGFAGMVQAGVEAMGVVNRSFGWGGDSGDGAPRRFKFGRR
ncbi:hypothetical protein Trco_001468 [Trichoderma cornu-damae]|uniref:Uncharacterized protein n=1 Tax=Trichoderma cornu-damae TaxID=654480 RepID=A0A9P8QXZ5_9HYPO|nr:hypothetical protein Trco_001468 [Trichoderma cornu-damae]